MIKITKEDILKFCLPEEEELKKCDNIPGMLGCKSGRVLYNISKLVPKDELIIEVGCWQGKSTSFLALPHKGKPERVITIDPFSQDLANKTLFEKHIALLGLQDTIKLVWGQAEGIDLKEANITDDRKISLFFYDGDHSTKLTVDTIKRYEPYFSDGCILVLDDILMEHVQDAIKLLYNYETVFRSGLSASPVDWHLGLAVLRYKNEKEKA